MTRLFSFCLLLIGACFLAGAYGALHNQISFTVGPDYFYHLKFQQFNIPDGTAPRIGAALVGWEASWWMGIVLGMPIGFLVQFMPDLRAQRNVFFLACLMCVTSALAMGVGSLLIEWPPENFEFMIIPEAAENPEGYLRAAIMHSFSYLGGLIGGAVALLTTSFLLWRARRG